MGSRRNGRRRPNFRFRLHFRHYGSIDVWTESSIQWVRYRCRYRQECVWKTPMKTLDLLLPDTV